MTFWVSDNLPYDVVIDNSDIRANPWICDLIQTRSTIKHNNRDKIVILLVKQRGPRDTQPLVNLRKYQTLMLRDHQLLKTPYIKT